MARRDVPVKKYAVRLSEDERRRLEEMVRKGKSPGEVIVESADIIESRRFRTRRRLERRGNHLSQPWLNGN
jgi:hypothetical protein